MKHTGSRFYAATALTLALVPNLALANTDGCSISGPADARLVIEEFADFQCHFCQIGSNTIQQVIKDYPGQVRVVFRNMPLPSHPQSQIAAKAFAAVCMQSPSLAGSYQAAIFANPTQLHKKGKAFLIQTARKLGVNIDKMKADMASEAVAQSLEADKAAAQSHQFTGTPSFVIGKEKVQGAIPYEEFKKILDAQL